MERFRGIKLLQRGDRDFEEVMHEAKACKVSTENDYFVRGRHCEYGVVEVVPRGEERWVVWIGLESQIQLKGRETKESSADWMEAGVTSILAGVGVRMLEKLQYRSTYI